MTQTNQTYTQKNHKSLKNLLKILQEDRQVTLHSLKETIIIKLNSTLFNFYIIYSKRPQNIF